MVILVHNVVHLSSLSFGFRLDPARKRHWKRPSDHTLFTINSLFTVTTTQMSVGTPPKFSHGRWELRVLKGFYLKIPKTPL